MHFPRRITIVFTLLLAGLATSICADDSAEHARLLEDVRRGKAAPAPTTRAAPSFTNTIGMKFVRIAPGEFMMGSPDSEKGRFPGESLKRFGPIGFGSKECPQNSSFGTSRLMGN